MILGCCLTHTATDACAGYWCSSWALMELEWGQGAGGELRWLASANANTHRIKTDEICRVSALVYCSLVSSTVKVAVALCRAGHWIPWLIPLQS